MNIADRRRRAATIEFEVVDPRSHDALASMTAYFDELHERFPTGFDPGDTLVADAPLLRPPVGVFVVATIDTLAAACGGVQVLEDGAAEIKRMWVHTDWRRLGLGKRLLSHLEKHAAELGNGTVRLDTNSVLTEAITMYKSAGYVEIPRYNDNPFAKHWFEKHV